MLPTFINYNVLPIKQIPIQYKKQLELPIDNFLVQIY